MSFHDGTILSYLGQTFDFSTKSKVKVTMENYVQDLLATHSVEGTANTPAAAILFDKEAKPLNPARAAQFHIISAKFLYLAKHVRACSSRPFNCDFISCLACYQTTEQDWLKLQRLLKYLNGTKEVGIVLEADLPIGVTAYVNASCAIRNDWDYAWEGIFLREVYEAEDLLRWHL